MLVVALFLVTADGRGQYGTANGEWPYYGGDLGSTRYAPLDQINRDNVSELEIVWRWSGLNFGPRPDYNFRATPIMMNGVLYTTAGSRRSAVAIDPATGETLWWYRFDEGERGASAPRKTSGRGVSYWSNGDDERIFFITPSYFMIALDANTGRPYPDFGRDGIVDLKEDLDQPIDLIKDAIGSSTPGIVIGDVIVIGAALPAGGAPPTKEMPKGYIRGYDVRTGKRLWIFHTIPQPGELGHDTWEGDSWKFTGNDSVWTSLSADPELGYVYLPTELPTGDYYGGHRLGDNLFSNSIVCLDAKTGERVWHFQTVHHGIWDYDLPAAPVLADITVDGKNIKAVAQVTKQGFTFVLDRETGEPVWPIEERPVLQTTIPEERTSPTQPFPTKPAPFDRQGVSEDDLRRLHAGAQSRSTRDRELVHARPSVHSPDLVTETHKGTLSLPGSQGGANWQGAALDPETGILYVSSSTYPTPLGLVHAPKRSNMDYIRQRRLFLPKGWWAPGPSSHQAPLGTHHRHRPEHRRARVDDGERRRARLCSRSPGARGGRDRAVGAARASGDAGDENTFFAGEGAGLPQPLSRRLRQPKRDELCRVVPIPHRDDDVLETLVRVGHGHVRLMRGKLELPEDLAGELVVSA